jgi:hypothetical protein
MAAAGTYQARVRAFLTAGGTTCYSGYSAYTAGTVYPSFTAGAITTASDTVDEKSNPGITITNAIPAFGGNGNITYQWRRRTGTSSATLTGNAATYSIGTSASTAIGTHYIKRYAHDATCNTAWEESTGQYTLTVTPLCPPNSVGPCTLTFDSQIWSGALRNPANCASASSLSTDFPPPAQYRDYSTSFGYYYNWTCVNTYATTLCPSPWRVPEHSDLNTLRLYMSPSVLTAAWWNTGTGYAAGSSMIDMGSFGICWSSTPYTFYQTYALAYSNSGMSLAEHRWEYGYQVHCVRDL